jgi:hypothetical protein
MVELDWIKWLTWIKKDYNIIMDWSIETYWIELDRSIEMNFNIPWGQFQLYIVVNFFPSDQLHPLESTSPLEAQLYP